MLDKLNHFKANFIRGLSNYFYSMRSKRYRGKQFRSRAKHSFKAKYHLYRGEKLHWLQVILRLQKSILPNILPWIVFCGGFGFLVSLIYYEGIHIAFDQESLITRAVLIFNIGLTLLLVFRTNTAHERFWEGRKLWGSLVNVARNLARNIWIVVKEKESKDRREKEATLKLVVAFAVAMKLHLRSEPVNRELASLMPKDSYSLLKETKHPPLQIAFWLGDYLQHQYNCDCLNIYQLDSLHLLVDHLVDILGGCERILKTPLPLIYTVILKNLVILYCLILPFEIVEHLNWLTGIITAFACFILLSIEQVGSEIEEPFGHDPNDLPLDNICNTIRRNVEELIHLAHNEPRSNTITIVSG